MANYHYMSPEDLVDALDAPNSFTKLAIVDCRDDDRGEGFIINSLNVPTNSATDLQYTALAKSLFEEGKETVVFHCALSQVRGPKGASRFVKAQSEAGYAMPVVYVLRGGWEAFYAMYGDTRPDLMYT